MVLICVLVGIGHCDLYIYSMIDSNAIIFKLFEPFKLLMDVFDCDHLVCMVALKWCCIMGANGAMVYDPWSAKTRLHYSLFMDYP